VKSAARTGVTAMDFGTGSVWLGVAESVTRSVTVKVPCVANVWLGDCPVPVGVLSPQVQLYEYGVVPPDAVAEKLTASPIIGLVGKNVKSARSAGVTGTDLDVVAVWGGVAASVTVSVTVKVPGAVYVWLGDCPEPVGVPSPQFQLYVYGVVPPVGFAEKATGSPAAGCAGVKVKLATSPAVTVIDLVRVPVWLMEFVTVSVTLRVPAEAYPWVTFCVVP